MILKRSTEILPHARKALTVLNRLGLHARPATQWVRCTQAFESTIHFTTAKGKRFHAGRIMDVLLADLSCGSTLTVEAVGRDAHEALERLEKLLIEFREQDKAEASDV